MPATPVYPQSPTPYQRALEELDRISLEGARVLARDLELLAHVRAKPETICEEDASLLREARRDLEHARILLEGLCRRHAIEVKA